MAIAAGTRLGPYEIGSPIGAGGMGEVYRARDAKLGRDVAIKILPEIFAADPERRGRFEREARTLAALNHPHIAQIYGFEESGPTLALAMELVEGETLADKLRGGHTSPPLPPNGGAEPRVGPLTIDEAVAIARQIADGLEAAHEQGIVHRDLKPANIKVRDDGTVKILDFGLAKALDPAASGSDLAMNSPTLTAHATVAGVILGTAAYMAPEQARGKAVDRRADIWAFGAVLFEMLTGRRAFPGEEISDTLASVLKDDPDWTALPAELPTSIHRVLRRCLDKDPRKRLSAIGDARLDLDERDEERRVQVAAPPPRSYGAWVLAATAVASLVAGATLIWVAAPRGSAPTAPLARFSIVPPDNTMVLRDSTSAVVSPDGRMVIIATGTGLRGGADNPTGLWLRSIDSLNIRPLAGTEDGRMPFWSPDTRQIAYFTDRKLKRIAIETGHIDEICDAADGRGGAWSSSGVIVFAPASTGPLMRVPASGGKPEPVTELDAARNESGHRFPAFLPDGDHFLYAAVPPRAEGFDILIGSLAGSSRERLLSAQSAPVFSPPGYLLYVRKGGLVAHPFDPGRRTLRGEPISVADAPGTIGDFYMAGAAVSSSSTGVLAYVVDLPQKTNLVELDQTGHQVGAIDIPKSRYDYLSLARDRRRAALVRWVSPIETDLWVVDLALGGASRLTGSEVLTQTVAWSPDGERIAYSSARAGPRDIYLKSVAGSGSDETVHQSAVLAKDPFSWSPDGRFLVYQEIRPETKWDVWVLPMAGDRKPVPYLRTPANEQSGVISPDGRWMAYLSDETGRGELYVQAFPVPGRKYRVTSDGASKAWWRNDSKQLLIANIGNTEILLADVHAAAEFAADRPRPAGRLPKGVKDVDATPDLKRLLALVNEDSGAKRSVAVVENWTAALSRQ